jgi:hypothetical protein
MQQGKQKFWATGVVVGILMIIGPSLASWFDHPVASEIHNALTMIGVVVAVVSLVFM